MGLTTHLDSRRMELRGVVRVAGEVIASYWPMRTFVHHNPLHGLEYLRFGDAIQLGKKFLGGCGYLAGAEYREYLRAGRIHETHLDAALAPHTRDEAVTAGRFLVSHAEVLRACLTHGLCESADTQPGPQGAGNPHGVSDLARHLAPALAAPTVETQITTAVNEDSDALCRFLTLSDWCDRTVGSEIVATVNAELIKWCAAFLDEGHATWPMPGREQGFYEAWKRLVAREWSPCGIAGSARKIADLPDHPEDAVLDALDALGIPDELRQDYLALQMTTLPGWAGFIKWRESQGDYPWQQAYPISLVKFLAVRLWYVRELVARTCKDKLGMEGRYGAIRAFMAEHPHEYFARREYTAGRLPAYLAEQVASGLPVGSPSWNAISRRFEADHGAIRDHAFRQAAAWRLAVLAEALNLAPVALLEATPEALATLVRWMDEFPEARHGPIWLEAFEAGYQAQLFGMLTRNSSKRGPPAGTGNAQARRPSSQAVFCMDVRSELIRRHLEAVGSNQTLGFPGFFAALIRFRAWGKDHFTDQFPVVMRARNEVRELPRSFVEHAVLRQKSRAKLLQTGHTLLRDLKENVVTPYVMVESLGWFYGLQLVGKTLWPMEFRRFTDWLGRAWVPKVATTLTVDKLPPAEVEDLLAWEQRIAIRKALRGRVRLRGVPLSNDFVEALRLHTLGGETNFQASLVAAAQVHSLGEPALSNLVDTLRREYRIEPRAASIKKERLTRTGFTLGEQVMTVETALRMMGLTRDFARLILLCGHGSTSENNPFESALDCGACGGNAGKPNARLLAMMANSAAVRERLAALGIVIPPDSWFVAGMVDTTTDAVELFDLEEVPRTHRQDVSRLQGDLREASRLTSQERCSRLGAAAEGAIADPPGHVLERSADWSQVRPEWGLSGNAAFIVGRRDLTRGLDLGGRVFLQSYDYREDPTGRSLEVILTGPQLVAQWIAMEHYFSTVDNEVYGSGSKVYHNVAGRIGVMSGPWSDLRLGLSRQTVHRSDRPYHEPMRLLTVVEAPRARLTALIGRHELLERYYHNEWVHLAALDPEDGRLYRYRPDGVWVLVTARKEAY
jgi:uncharacterized protein YbcC (UPF0753/DUF2309 family)